MNKEINELINEALKDNAFPGACLCIVKDDKVSLESYGLKAKYPNEEDNNLDTIYDMASCSKVISTTTSILILLEQGKLRLYEPVCNIIPEFSMKNVTVWDLLTHTAGLPEGLKGSWEMTKEQIYDGIMKLEPIYPKNTKIVYSDLGFMLLGFIIEKVSGMNYYDFLDKTILSPLKMTDTHHLIPNYKLNRVASNNFDSRIIKDGSIITNTCNNLDLKGLSKRYCKMVYQQVQLMGLPVLQKNYWKCKQRFYIQFPTNPRHISI